MFISIAPTRRTNADGQLADCRDVTKHCEFIALRPWRHHPGYWTFTTTEDFPGGWGRRAIRL